MGVYRMSADANAILAKWWPSLVSGAGVKPGLTDAAGSGLSFDRAMRGAQAELIRHYLPAMALDRVPWALRTLQRLERSLRAEGLA